MAPSVTVFVDYQNVHFSARRLWCDPQDPPENSLIDPLRLAERLVDMRAPGGDLKQVRVYRGRPNPSKQARQASYNDKQKMAWEQDNRVLVIRRMLAYPEGWQPSWYERPREKGIDVSLAVDMVRLAIAGEFDCGIVVSRDTDLLPALETIRELGGAHIEVATWEGASRLRLAGRPLWCHKLTHDDFLAVRDDRNYN